MEFSRPDYCNRQPFPSPGDLPNPGIKPRPPALQVDSLPADPPGKPKNTCVGSLSLLQIFLTQELNQDLLHCRQILYQLSYKGNPIFSVLSMYKCKEQILYVITCEWNLTNKTLLRGIRDQIKSVTQSCPTLCDPMNYTVHGIFQARILEWVAYPFSRGSSQSKDQTQVSCIAGGFFTI